MKSLKGLAWKLSIPLDVLRELADSVDFQYRSWPQTRHGKTRTLTAPSERLKSAQTQIYEKLLKPLGAPAHLHGSVPGKSPYTNSTAHAAQPCLIRIDITSFFPSVTPPQVYSVWVEKVGCSPQVASLLTKLTTFKFALPQGAPTSPALANLVLADADENILELASGTNVRFTRYVDDLGLSGSAPQDLIEPVAKELQRGGFRVSRKKLACMPRAGRQEITGYGANAPRPSIGKTGRSRIRAAIHRLNQLPADSEAFRREALSVHGRIDHLRRSNPGAARRLERYLKKMAPEATVS